MKGFGMDWNLHKEAFAISAGDDGQVCVWDISHASKLDRIVRPFSKFCFGRGTGLYVWLMLIQDIKWHKKDANIFACTTSNGDLLLYFRISCKVRHQIDTQDHDHQLCREDWLCWVSNRHEFH